MQISDGYTFRLENDFIIISAKRKCKEIIAKIQKAEGDNIDFLINLHFVLEVGLNTFFRHIALMGSRVLSLEPIDGAKLIDSIPLTEKVAAFIAFSNFEYREIDEMDLAHKHLSVIKSLRLFSEVRNKLIHGHMIGRISHDLSKSGAEPVETSKAFDLCSDDSLSSQIKLFKKIMESVSFFLERLKSGLTESGKATFKKEYLDTSFLN